MIFPTNFEEKLGFTKIRQLLRDNTLCSLGVLRVDAMSFSTDRKTLQHELDLLREMMQVLQNTLKPMPTDGFYDLLEPLNPNMNVVQFDNEEDWHKYRDFLRPVLLDFDSCENVLIEQVCFQNSPAWCLHPFRCHNVIINNVLVVNPWYSQNGDGLDLEASKDVLVLNSKFDVGDDAICLKSGKDKDGRELNSPCENVIVDGCSVYHGHGGFVVGSEMSSSVKNICVKNCTFLGTDVGLRFKSKRGRGGCVGNIYIDNINMIGIETDCILFDLNYSGLSASEERALISLLATWQALSRMSS